MSCYQNNKNFKTAISSNPKVKQLLSADEIEACFNEASGLANVNYIFKQVGII